MPYDEAKWKRSSLAHYLALARLDVPHAADTALMLATAAEACSAGGLAGLVDKLRQELGLPEQKTGRQPREHRHRN